MARIFLLFTKYSLTIWGVFVHRSVPSGVKFEGRFWYNYYYLIKIQTIEIIKVKYGNLMFKKELVVKSFERSLFDSSLEDV